MEHAQKRSEATAARTRWKRTGQLVLIAALLSLFDYLAFPAWPLRRTIAFFIGFTALLVVPYWWRTHRGRRPTVNGVVVEAVLIAALFGLVTFLAFGWSARGSAIVFAVMLAVELIGGALRLKVRPDSGSGKADKSDV